MGPMSWNPEIRPFGGSFLRWLPWPLLLGSLSSAAAQWLIGPSGVLPMLVSALVGAVCTLLLWGGYELLSPWIQAHAPQDGPTRAALVSLAKWMLTYGALTALFLLVANGGLHLRVSAPFTLLMGLLLSSLIVSVRNTSAQVATARALERAQASARLVALRSQLSPHTLFNGLNAIAALIPGAPKDAERCVEHLSVLLRQTMEALERESWTLGEELALLEHLLELERIRFGPRLSVEIRLPGEDRDRPIPPLLLLPLVENGLKHGFRPKVGPCRLAILVSGPRIRIQDDGVGRPPEAPEGLGLRTVRQRVEALGGRLEWPPVEAGCLVEVILCP